MSTEHHANTTCCRIQDPTTSLSDLKTTCNAPYYSGSLMWELRIPSAREEYVRPHKNVPCTCLLAPPLPPLPLHLPHA